MAETPTHLRRHYMNYTFFKLDHTWRRLDPDTRAAHKAELAELIEAWSERLVLRSFSTIGSRADADLLLWQATPDYDLLGELHADIFSTEMGAWFTTPYLYTSTTKETQYRRDTSEFFKKQRPLDVVPIDRKYFIIYPMDKQRPWYALERDERGEAMRDHAMIGRKYPSVKLNTGYSFGIDDQEFVVAFETDEIQDFLDLMMELRAYKASQYTLRDTPIFTCTRMSMADALDRLGGARTRAHVPA